MKKTILFILVLSMTLIVYGCHSHTFSEWKIICDRTCDTNGELQRFCTKCGYVESQIDECQGHQFIPANYYNAKTCMICGFEDGDPLAKFLKKGQEIKEDSYSIKVEDVLYCWKANEKHNGINYSFGDDGLRYLVVKLNFTNNDVINFDNQNKDRFTDIEICFSNRYRYEGDYVILDENIKSFEKGNVYIKFVVPESIEKNKEAPVLINFRIDEDLYVIEVNKGKSNYKMAAIESNNEEILSKNTNRNKNNFYSFKIEDAFFSSKYSEKHGSKTDYLFWDNNTYFVIKVSFTNYSNEVMSMDNISDRFENILLKYDDKYEFEGTAAMIIEKIVPCSTGKVYLYFKVPKSVKDSSKKSLTVSFELDFDKYTYQYRK